VALAALAAALVARLALDPYLGNQLPYVTFFVAVTIVAWCEGLGPTLVTIAAGACVSDYFFVTPRHSFAIAGIASQVGFGAYFMVTVPIAFLAHRQKRDAAARIKAEERLLRQEAMRESEEQFRTLANAIPQLCWMANPDGGIFWYNQRWYEYSGTTPVQMEASGWQSVHNPETLPIVLERWGASIATGEPLEMVFPLRRADGVFRPFLTRVMPVRDAEGKVIRWFGTNTDISEQKQIEAELRRSKERLDLALEVASVGEWEIDLKLHTGSRSKRHAEIFGDSSSETDWSFESFIEHVVPEHRAEIKEKVKASLTSGVWDFETQIRRADGEIRWIWARGCSLLDETVKPVRMYGTVMDITERKRAEVQLALMNRLYATLSQVNQAIVRVKEPSALYQSMCDVAVEFGGFTLAWVGLFDRNSGDIRPVAANGADVEQWPFENVNISRGVFKDGMAARAIQSGKVVVTEDIENDGRLRETFGQVRGRDFHSAAVIPFRQRDETVGVLALVSREAGFFEAAEEVNLLEEMGMDISYALDTMATEAQRKLADEALRESEQQYRGLFQTNPVGLSLMEVICDAEGQPNNLLFLNVNPAFEAFTRMKAADLVGRTVLEAVPRADHAVVERQGRVALTGVADYFDGFSAAYNRYWEVTAFSPRHGQCVTYVTDVTERKLAEAAQQESAERLRLFIEHAPAALAMFDTEMRYLSVSRRWLADYGLGDSDVHGLSHYEVFPEVSDQWKSVHLRGLAGEVLREDADSFVRADGSVRWLSWEVRPWYDTRGNVGGIVIFTVDITERKRAEAALQEDRAKLDAALASMTDAVFISDIKGQFINFNDAFAVFHRFKNKGECAKKLGDYPELLDVFTPDGELAPLEMWAVPRALRGETATNAEYKLRRKDTGETWVGSYSFSPIRDSLGAIVGAVVVSRDVTDRKLVEIELENTRLEAERSAAQLRTVLDNMEERLYVCDHVGKVIVANEAARKTYGPDGGAPSVFDMEEFIEVSSIDGRPLPKSEWPISRVLRGERIHSAEIRVRFRATGEERVLSSNGASIRDRSGNIVMAVLTSGDITERKRAEQEVHELNSKLEDRVRRRTAELESANKELEAFSYSVSHDLRAPLRAIDGFSQAVVEDYGSSLPAEGQEYLETICRGAKRMGELIDDLLAFSRLSRQSISPSPIDTCTLVSQCLEDLESTHKNRVIEFSVGELPSCLGDRALLKQVWTNLLSNAIKFTSNRPCASVQVGAQLESGKVVYFIKDNGAGFDMKYANKLFGVFQRLHRNDEFEGTGVGLAIVQRIVHRHGGRVWADAVLDQGATFYFTVAEIGETHL
jgi:PAS domain S-box-containing protein